MARDLLDSFSIRKWSFSWFLAATKFAFTVAIVYVLYLFLFPLAHSTDYFNVARDSYIPSNSSSELTSNHDKEESPTNLKHRLPVDLHKEFIYRGAPWKADIGKWLASCDSITKGVNIIEKISSNNCKNGCNDLGVCNQELGVCRCFHGYTGDGCTETVKFECNYPESPNEPFGEKVISICPAKCDKTRAMCFCGEGTKYSNRPLTWSLDWTKFDHNVFTTNSSIPGWCNVDPAEAYARKVKVKEGCDCNYDGYEGNLCEIPVQSVCINQCSGHGHCRGGFCQCGEGWYGVDCSIPSVISSTREWPSWLLSTRVDVPNNFHDSGKNVNLNVVVTKKRPLIYVYDLPPEFNSMLFEGRHFINDCVNRIYAPYNATIWTDQLYGAQMAIYESMLASSHRTLNSDEADFFFVPVLDSCLIDRANDSPNLSTKNHGWLRRSLTLEYYKNAYDHIVEKYPYWNRSSGRDHIWFFSWDEGACYAPKEIWKSMMLVHWGNTNTQHYHSTTAYWADDWDYIPSNRRGVHPCFDPDKDFVLPAWKNPDVGVLSSKLWARPHEKRKTLFYFNGNLGSAYAEGRSEDKSNFKFVRNGCRYSMGLRQKVAEEFGSSPNKEGKLGKQHAKDVIVTPVRTDKYHEEVASSIFCGVLPGDGWSGRMEDSILQGCIPVIIQDGIFLPYENVFNYDSFAVRIPEAEIPNLIKILRGFNDTEIKYKLANVQKIWQRFFYRDSILLEAVRQKAVYRYLDEWAIELSKLTEDDVFTTLMQVFIFLCQTILE
ncbi:putative EGF-like domain, exostosin [Lupinus albus]|uniref:Putative EGF-like domain, exostosin n=1 Tax=Lupinus albus TaxID=3870 RepID=A0A6A4QIM3_LUPAL|nr:putative EGF-like domain, exostosin [Lupinus albus]